MMSVGGLLDEILKEQLGGIGGKGGKVVQKPDGYYIVVEVTERDFKEALAKTGDTKIARYTKVKILNGKVVFEIKLMGVT